MHLLCKRLSVILHWNTRVLRTAPLLIGFHAHFALVSGRNESCCQSVVIHISWQHIKPQIIIAKWRIEREKKINKNRSEILVEKNWTNKEFLGNNFSSIKIIKFLLHVIHALVYFIRKMHPEKYIRQFGNFFLATIHNLLATLCTSVRWILYVGSWSENRKFISVDRSNENIVEEA